MSETTPRMIKVRTLGSETKREVTLEEAVKMVDETYNNVVGGLVADGKTSKIIWQIGPETEEIIILQHNFGGG